MDRAQYKNWAVDSQGDVIGGVAYEVRVKSSGALADLYAGRTGATTVANPGTAEAGGDFTFWADAGLYDITIGIAPSETTSPWSAIPGDVASVSLQPFADTAELEAATIPASVELLAVLGANKSVSYYRRSATPADLESADGAYWVLSLPFQGAVRDYQSRADAVSAISGGFLLPNGFSFLAGGVAYTFDSTAGNPISDMPGVVPSGDLLSAFNVQAPATAAENDTALAELQAYSPDALLDLKGLTFPVTTVPSIAARNGFWQIEDFDQGLTARLPADDTIKINTALLTRSQWYESWPQDKAFLFKPRGPENANSEEVLHALWNVGSGHGNADMSTSIIRGTPKRMGPKIEHWFMDVDSGVGVGGSTWSAGEIHGQMLAINRIKDSTATITDHKLMGRRLHENRVSQALTVAVANGSTDTDVTFTGANGGDVHGLKVGDRFGVAGASGAVGGVTLSGEYTVTAVTDESTVTITTAAGSSDETAGITTSRVIFYEDGFEEILVDGGSGSVSLSNALADADGVNWPNPATEWHSFGTDGVSEDFWVAIHGGSGNAAGAWLVKVVNTLRAATIDTVVSIGSGIEPAIWHVEGGKVYGAIRHQSSSSPLRLFVYEEGVGTTIHDFPDNDFAVKCVMSGDEWNGQLVAVVNGTRGLTDSTPAGKVGLYAFVWNSLGDFEANGFDNAEVTYLGSDNWQADTFDGTDTSAVGVGSTVVQSDGVICIVGAQENPNTEYDRDGHPDIVLRYVYGLLADEPYEGAWGSWSSQYASEPPMEPEFRTIVARPNLGGGFDYGPKFDGQVSVDSANGGTGIYDISFVDAYGNALNLPVESYYPVAMATGGNRWAREAAAVTGGFEVRILDSSAVAINSDFILKIDYRVLWNILD